MRKRPDAWGNYGIFAALALADEAKVMEELRKSCQCDSEEEHRRMKAKLAESESRLS